MAQSPVRPQDLGAGAVVLRVREDLEDVVHQVPHQGLCDGVGEVHVVIVGEIALHRVHDHVRDAGRRLVRGQGEGADRVHDGELGPAQLVGIAQLHVAVLVRDDAGFAHLAARGRDREVALRRGLAQVEVPDFAVIRDAAGDGLGRVDDGTAADGEDEIHALLAAQVDALVDEGQPRVRNDPAQADEVHAAVAEQAADLVQQAGLLGALTAVMDQHLVTAVLLHESGHFFLGLLPEHDFGRGVIDEISHIQCVLYKYTKS